MLNDHTFCIRDQLEWSRVSTDQVKLPQLYYLFREKARRSELQTTVYCGVGSVRNLEWISGKTERRTHTSTADMRYSLQKKVGHIKDHVSSFLIMRPF